MENLPQILLERYRLPVGVFLVVAVVIGGVVWALLNTRSQPPEIHKIEESSSDQLPEATVSNVPIATKNRIKVDVAGAVTNPGVYELDEEARVEEALNAAGGLAEGADREWVAKNLNLAARLSDGDKIYIPAVGETAKTSSSANTPAVPPSSVGVVSGTGSSISSASNCSRVNINTASAGTLDECLSGIGPAYAQNIIDYREAHGGFKSIEEIQEVRGIGPKTFEKIKDQITVN
jgi:competence protein ComEA